MRYEIGVSIPMGYIVWVNGPYPCGAWPDLKIFRDCLIHNLDEGEYVLADGGYSDINGRCFTPSGRHDFQDRQESVVRARHETLNTRFKKWGALHQVWRHPLIKHGIVFHAIANILQVCIEEGLFIWEVEYSDNI